LQNHILFEFFLVWEGIFFAKPNLGQFELCLNFDFYSNNAHQSATTGILCSGPLARHARPIVARHRSCQGCLEPLPDVIAYKTPTAPSSLLFQATRRELSSGATTVSLAIDESRRYLTLPFSFQCLGANVIDLFLNVSMYTTTVPDRWSAAVPPHPPPPRSPLSPTPFR
jgi:hypothetical protein